MSLTAVVFLVLITESDRYIHACKKKKKRKKTPRVCVVFFFENRQHRSGKVFLLFGTFFLRNFTAAYMHRDENQKNDRLTVVRFHNSHKVFLLAIL